MSRILKSGITRLALGLACGGFFAPAALAQMPVQVHELATDDPNYLANATDPGTGTFVAISGIGQVLGASQDDIDTMHAAYGGAGWRFVNGGALHGDLYVNKYKASAPPGASGGAHLNITYNRDPGDPPLANLFWLQIVNGPVLTGGTPAVDPVPPDDSLPFYFTSAEESGFRDPMVGDGDYGFDDAPETPYPAAPGGPAPTTSGFGAMLYLVSWDGSSHDVMVHSGFSWAFYMIRYPRCCMMNSARPADEQPSSPLLASGPFVLLAGGGRRARRRRSFTAFAGIALLMVFIVFAYPLLAAQGQVSPRRKLPANSCRLALKLAQKEYKEGEPIAISLRFRNASSVPVTIWSSGFYVNHNVIVTDDDREVVQTTEFGKRCQEMFDSPSGARGKNFPIEIAPGETCSEGSVADLTRLYVLKPGRYQVRVIYRDEHPPTPVQVTSNSVAFEVQ